MKRILILFILPFLYTPLLNAQNSLKNLVKKNEPAVFSIFTYDEFGVPQGSGTGFFVDSSGIGITNYHVLKGAAKAIVKLNNKTSYKIKEILKANKDIDLVRFKIDNSEHEIFPFLNLKNNLPQKGENIFVIGNPEGFESTVSKGIISSIRKAKGYKKVIQITAPISPGSSGSPVMTMNGNVIGVASFQYTKGQNLNFAVPSKMIGKLPNNNSLILNSPNNFFVVNKESEDNSELVLNSLVRKGNKTVLNFSFTNVTIGYGKFMFIWTKLNTRNKTFFIQDLSTMKKYYATGSTIGPSRKAGTKVNLGQTKSFKVFFKPLPRNISKVNIMEGINGSWNFKDINLSKYKNIKNQSTKNYSKQFALSKLTNKNFEEARKILSERIKNHEHDDEAYNIMGIISFLIDNNHDAIKYFSKAININSSNDIYYFNRFSVYVKQKNYHKALSDINNSIRIVPSQGDYYLKRAGIYSRTEKYEKALTNLNLAINLMGDNAELLKIRGTIEALLKHYNEACRDWKKSYRINNQRDSKLRKLINRYCN